MTGIRQSWTTVLGDTVEVYETGFGALREFRFRVQAANGEIVATGSEGYTRKSAAAEAARRYFPEDSGD